MKNLFTLSKWVEPVFITPDHSSYWFGYYNYSPIDSNNKRMLAHCVNFDGRDINADDIAEVGWFDLKDGSWHLIGKTRAFNWQQGSMLQWLGPEFDGSVIYNDEKDGHYISRIVELDSQKSKTLPWPTYAVTPDGNNSITLQYERSYWCRAYHYESVRNKKWDRMKPEEDGIFSIDHLTGKVKRIIEINSILEYEKDPSFDSAKHWFEHIMLNPAGNRFAFYHRFSEENGHRTRAFTSDINGGSIYLLPEWQNYGYSHLGWKNNDEFVIFASKRLASGRVFDKISKGSKLGKFLQESYRSFLSPLIPNKIRSMVACNMQYQLYHDRHGMIDHYNHEKLLTDGHPSFSANGLYMLTDTYADLEGYRYLFLYNTLSKKVIELGQFFSPFNECSYRSDLHPRFNRDESMVIIDTAHTGKHQIMVLTLNWKEISNYML